MIKIPRFNIVMVNDGDGHFDQMERYQDDGELVFYSEVEPLLRELEELRAAASSGQPDVD